PQHFVRRPRAGAQGPRGRRQRRDHDRLHRRRRHDHGGARRGTRQAALHAAHLRRRLARRDACRAPRVGPRGAGESGEGGADSRVPGMVRKSERGTRNAERIRPLRFRLPRFAFRVCPMSLVDRVRALLGSDAVDLAATPDGVPRVAPASPDAVALLLGTAREEGWRLRVEGAGTWLPADAPADLALTTRRLDKIPAIEPQDLSATAEAGIGCDLLRQQLADRGTWLALDPPGLAGRTLGSVVATATAGPSRHGFGAVRDHLLGVTFVTGDGRLVQSGGRVMKNVAGYELTKLAAAGRGRAGRPLAARVRRGARPPARRHLRDRRRAPGAARRACDEERRGVRSHRARRGRVRGVRRARAGAPAAPRRTPRTRPRRAW